VYYGFVIPKNKCVKKKRERKREREREREREAEQERIERVI
jgi:hypothetical protein